MKDLIDRAKAIEAIYYLIPGITYERAQNIMRQVPSKEPEWDAINKALKSQREGIISAEKACEYIRECLRRLGKPERKTGKWIKSMGTINCSNCKQCSWSESFEATVHRFKYCPNCGAKMIGENK